MKVLVTGAAGYIGKILVKKLIQNQNIDAVFALDKKGKPKDFENLKVNYFQLDLARDAWEEKLPNIPDVIIHLAFDIRTPYGKRKDQEFNNLFSMERVLGYCSNKKVSRLIYSSSVSAYGARKENIGKFLKEDSQLTENEYPYGDQKKKIEEILKEKKISTQIFVLRLASVNGPEGEKRKGFGLLNFIKHIFPILPVINNTWTRQYLHEEDALRVIDFLIFKETKDQFNVFNIALSDFLTISKMAKLINKKIIKIPVWIIKPIFFLVWHLTFGRVSTPKGSERFFTYPINVNGSKIENLGFNYKYSLEEAFLGRDVN